MISSFSSLSSVHPTFHRNQTIAHPSYRISQPQFRLLIFYCEIETGNYRKYNLNIEMIRLGKFELKNEVTAIDDDDDDEMDEGR